MKVIKHNGIRFEVLPERDTFVKDGAHCTVHPLRVHPGTSPSWAAELVFAEDPTGKAYAINAEGIHELTDDPILGVGPTMEAAIDHACTEAVTYNWPLVKTISAPEEPNR